MRYLKQLSRLALTLVCACSALLASAADYPAPREASWVARDFRTHTGEVMPQLQLYYRTIGAPTGEPVLVLHGTAGSGASMLTPAFAGELFGPGQPLDASRYYIIIPDTLGHGKSSKPSDGLRMKFPKYNYDDMVDAHYRLLTEHLNVRHLRLVIGNSMGGMETWIFAVKYPDYMDIAVPMACLPTEMSSRNWMLRRLIVDSIRNDPDWKDGQYTQQPRSARFASAFFGIATSGGNQALYKAAPTREKADQLLDQRLAAPFPADANDVLYQWDSSRDYNPSPGLDKIKATVLAINAADDERNPVELGLLDREIKRVKNARVLLIPASENTAGHGTTGMAKFYQRELGELLKSAPPVFSMSYIDGSLLEGERVVYRTRLHWLMVIAPVFFTAIVMAPIAWFVSTSTWSSYTWIPIVIWLLVLAAAVIKRQSSDFAVTNKRVMMKIGVFSARSVELLLNKIEAIAVDQSFAGRMFGYGDLAVTGSGGTVERFSNIQRPLEFRRAVQSVTDARTERPTS